MARKTGRILAVVAVMALGSAVVGVGESALQASGTQVATVGGTTKGYEAHTEPSIRSRVNFAAQGVVAEVMVKEGDVVKKGDVLIRLDDRADRHFLEALEMEGKSTLKIEAAKADLEQKRVDLARKLKSQPEGGASPLEVEEAKVNVLIREIQVKVEEMTRRQKELEAMRQAVRVEQMTLTAPFDAVVEKIDLKPGETPEVQRFALTLVDNTPVWVNVFLPTRVALKLKVGDSLEVRYKDVDEVVMGKVIMLSPVADAGSEQRLVRLELPNEKELPAGLGVVVTAEDVVKPSASW